MIISQLRTVLANHRMTITALSRATGIPRATLTLLADNKNVGVQFTTLDKICMALHTEPSSLFLYAPFSIEARLGKFDVPSYGTDESFSFSAPFTLALICNGETSEKELTVNVDFVPSEKHFVIYLPSKVSTLLKPVTSLQVLFKISVLDKIFTDIATALQKPKGYEVIQVFGDGIL